MLSLITNLWQKANLNIKIASSVVTISILWMLTGVVGCSEQQASAPHKIIKTVAIQDFPSALFTPKVELIAQTQAENAITISAEIKGSVEEKVEDGTLVKKGDTLLKLSIDTLENQLLAAKAHLEEAEELYKSAKELRKEGFKASTDLAAKKASLEDAKLAVKAVEIDLQRIHIQAPTDGKVDFVMPEIGEYVVAGQEIINFVGNGGRKLVAHVSQKQRSLIKPDVPVVAHLVDGTKVTGVINSVALQAAELTKTYRITAILDEEFDTIPLGMSARMYIPSTSVKAHKVPHSTLVLNSAGDIGVMTIQGKKSHFTPVEILEDSRDGMWVKGIEAETAKVVIRGQSGIKDNERVKPVYETIKG
jgi:multidrug efflux system membrane fusion protein